MHIYLVQDIVPGNSKEDGDGALHFYAFSGGGVGKHHRATRDHRGVCMCGGNQRERPHVSQPVCVSWGRSEYGGLLQDPRRYPYP